MNYLNSPRKKEWCSFYVNDLPLLNIDEEIIEKSMDNMVGIVELAKNTALARTAKQASVLGGKGNKATDDKK